MDVATFLARARRASRRSPRYLAGRVWHAGRQLFQKRWSRAHPATITDRALLAAAGASSIDALWEAQQSVPFFLAPANRDAWTTEFERRYPEVVPQITKAADRALRHEFDLLGSGVVCLGAALPWHTDFKTGREWPVEYAPSIEYAELDRPTDVKVPWELSRCQHFTALGQAYWLTGDERYAQEFVTEVTDWIARNRWGYGVNWICAMDVALRAVSWIWAFYYMADSAACRSRRFRSAFLRSLYLHGEYVATHLERGEVNGNHYLCDGVGLVFLGAFFRSTRAGRRWIESGKAIVGPEIFNQTSADGVDFEKSTAYHRLVLEGFLTSQLLLHAHGESFDRAWLERLERMFEFVEAYVKPDGTVPLIGDADDGRIQKLGQQDINDHRYLLSTAAVLFERRDFKGAARSFHDEAFWLLGPAAAKSFDALPLESTRVSSKAFPDGGFYVLRSSRAHVIIDCGEVGMHGRGGHGHNDILSVEVWLDGMNVVTDCGAYLYTASREWRNRFRSTEFHNVVQVDDEEVNRFISPDHLWHLQYDASPENVTWTFDDRMDLFRGGHTGYARLMSPVQVRREVQLHKSGPSVDNSEPSVAIVDSVDGADVHKLVWRFHLDPSFVAEPRGRDVRLSRGERSVWLRIDGDAGLAVSVQEGWVSASYGVRTPNQVVVVEGRLLLPQVASFHFSLDTPSRNRAS